MVAVTEARRASTGREPLVVAGAVVADGADVADPDELSDPQAAATGRRRTAAVMAVMLPDPAADRRPGLTRVPARRRWAAGVPAPR